uniref:Uncharacterized protein n=1 Tax=Glossina brevipalpis TaxID=37001 RepID=A0A1A9WKR8_9MUSC
MRITGCGASRDCPTMCIIGCGASRDCLTMCIIDCGPSRDCLSMCIIGCGASKDFQVQIVLPCVLLAAVHVEITICINGRDANRDCQVQVLNKSSLICLNIGNLHRFTIEVKIFHNNCAIVHDCNNDKSNVSFLTMSGVLYGPRHATVLQETLATGTSSNYNNQQKALQYTSILTICTDDEEKMKIFKIVPQKMKINYNRDMNYIIKLLKEISTNVLTQRFVCMNFKAFMPLAIYNNISFHIEYIIHHKLDIHIRK